MDAEKIENTGEGGWSQERDALQAKVAEQAIEIQKLLDSGLSY